MEESPALEAYPDPPRGSRLNPTVIVEFAAEIEEDECDQGFPPVFEEGGNNEGEEFGMLECPESHHSPIFVTSSSAPAEAMLGTRDQTTLVRETLAPHYIMVEDSPSPQYMVVEESPVPMSDVKSQPCLVVECRPEPTGERARTTSPVPMNGPKDQLSLVDDSLGVP